MGLSDFGSKLVSWFSSSTTHKIVTVLLFGLVTGGYLVHLGSDTGGDTVIATTSYNLTDTPETSIITVTINSQSIYSAAQSDALSRHSVLNASLVTWQLDVLGGNNVYATAKFYAPDKIYGPNAFPVQFIWQPAGNTDVKQSFWVTFVEINVVDNEGHTWDRFVQNYTMSQTGGSPGVLLEWTPILKAPDQYLTLINAIMNGQLDETTLSMLKYSPAYKPFVIQITVRGVLERWYWDGNSSTWVYEGTIPFDQSFVAGKAYSHINEGFYVWDGFSEVVPAYLQGDSIAHSWAPYGGWERGALNNLGIRYWGVVMNLSNGNAEYQFYVYPSAAYLEPFFTAFGDDARLILFRVLTNGSYEIADIQPASSAFKLGDLGNAAKGFTGVLYYNAGGESAVNFKAVLVAKATVVDHYGRTHTVWDVYVPYIIVIEGQQVIDSNNISQISAIVEDGTINVLERSQLQTEIDAMISGISSKLIKASYVYSEAEGQNNTLAMEYASSAIQQYSDAIELLSKAKGADADGVKNLIIAARLKEEAADLNVKAAQLALAGDVDNAKNAHDTAEKLDKQANIGPGGILPGTFDKDTINLVILMVLLIVGIVAIVAIMGMMTRVGGPGFSNSPVGILIAMVLAFVIILALAYIYAHATGQGLFEVLTTLIRKL